MQVIVRIEPLVTYGAPLLILAPNFATTLNRLQQFWARTILGCSRCPRLPWALTLAQCGWHLRLSSKVIEQAIMARARLAVLPTDHPGARMLRLSLAGPHAAWSMAVKAHMQFGDPSGTISDIWECVEFQDLLDLARQHKQLRHRLLTQYRHHKVRPALTHRELLWFHQTAKKIIPAFSVAFEVFQGAPQKIPIDLLSWDFSSSWWLWYRAWALVRISGRWPRTILGLDEMPTHITYCTMCQQEQVDVSHALCYCPSSLPLLTQLQSQVAGIIAVQGNIQALSMFLFGPQGDKETLVRCIAYVGRVICRCMSPRGNFSTLATEVFSDVRMETLAHLDIWDASQQLPDAPDE